MNSCYNCVNLKTKILDENSFPKSIFSRSLSAKKRIKQDGTVTVYFCVMDMLHRECYINLSMLPKLHVKNCPHRNKMITNIGQIIDLNK